MSADFQANEKLNIYANALYSNATADWKGLNISTPAAVNDLTLTGAMYDISSVNIITEYSDLEYIQTELNLGGVYQFTPALHANLQVGMQTFEDKSPYVYGDQDGTSYSGNVGVGYKF